jgi:hypothetical protein
MRRGGPAHDRKRNGAEAPPKTLGCLAVGRTALLRNKESLLSRKDCSRRFAGADEGRAAEFRVVRTQPTGRRSHADLA